MRSERRGCSQRRHIAPTGWQKTAKAGYRISSSTPPHLRVGWLGGHYYYYTPSLKDSQISRPPLIRPDLRPRHVSLLPFWVAVQPLLAHERLAPSYTVRVQSSPAPIAFAYPLIVCPLQQVVL